MKLAKPLNESYLLYRRTYNQQFLIYNRFFVVVHCCPVKILKYHLSSNSRNSVLDIQALI